MAEQISEIVVPASAPTRRNRLAAAAGALLAMLAIVAGMGIWSYDRETSLSLQGQRTAARLLIDQALLVTHWRHLSATTSGQRPPSPMEGRAEDESLLPLIAQLTTELSRQPYFAEFLQPGIRYGLEAPQDEFERTILQRFLRSPASESRAPEYAERTLPDRDVYQYYEPIRAQQSCLVCHGRATAESGLASSGSKPLPSLVLVRAEGDVMAVVRITIPRQTLQ